MSEKSEQRKNLLSKTPLQMFNHLTPKKPQATKTYAQTVDAKL